MMRIAHYIWIVVTFLTDLLELRKKEALLRRERWGWAIPEFGDGPAIPDVRFTYMPIEVLQEGRIFDDGTELMTLVKIKYPVEVVPGTVVVLERGFYENGVEVFDRIKIPKGYTSVKAPNTFYVKKEDIEWH